jgi:class 3 adenylate cyclase
LVLPARRCGSRALGRRDGVFVAAFDGPARAIRCAGAIADRLRPLGIAARSGLHAGEIAAQRDYSDGAVAGIAAHLATLAKPGETLASSGVHSLCVGARLDFRDHGAHPIAGLPEPIQLYAVPAGIGPRRRTAARADIDNLGDAADD